MSFAIMKAQNPFEKFGYEPKIGTLSKGKYIEHFDNDSIVQIGTILLNTRSKQIVGFVEETITYSEATLEPSISSRWMNPDPLSDEFPDKSPYNFVNNNPIRYVDPLGLAPEDVVIWYMDNNDEQQSFTYTGDNGDQAPDNDFVNAVLEASCNNCSNGGGENLQAIAENSEIVVNVVETDGSSVSTYNNIYWNPEGGAQYDTGVVVSPATVLEHEADHTLHRITKPDEHRQLRDTPDATYKNKEEKRVITGSEQRTARANGEISGNQVTRRNHDGHTVITTGTTSNKVNRLKTYQHYVRRNRTEAGDFSKQLKRYKTKQ